MAHSYVTFPPAIDLSTLPKHERASKLINALSAGGALFKTKRGRPACAIAPTILARLSTQLKFQTELGLDGTRNVIFND